MVHDGVLTTPPVTASLPAGHHARHGDPDRRASMGYEVREIDVVRTDLYHADEVFFTGTAAEITPIRSIDEHEIGAGPITKRIQTEFFAITKGRSELSPEFLDYPAATAAKA